MGNYKSIYTKAVHAGVEPDETTGAIMTPIYQTSTFVQQAPGVHKGWDYTRGGNPTRDALEESFAALENAKHGLAFSSGLAAVQAVIQTLKPKDHVLVCDDVYGGTGRLFRKLFAKYNIEFDFIDMTNIAATESKFKAETALVWVESPTNPLLKVIDVRKMSELSKKNGAVLVVDNTFASPVFQSPLELGADVVMHSTTKYIGGHSDIVGGALMLNDEKFFEELKFIQFAAGAVTGPMESWLLLRSVKTLAVRMERHQKNALKIAKFLEDADFVDEVFYPGLESHPQYALAKSQMSGFSGIVSFNLKGDFDDVTKFTQKLEIVALAESLGGVESLINHPEQMTHASVPEALRKELGIGPQLLRLSVGIEDADELIADLQQAAKVIK